MKKLFIISGEKSGDLIANSIIAKAKEQFPNVEIKGIGGESFAKNGITSLFNQSELSIMGFLEILPKLKRMFQLISLTTQAIQEFQPQHIITIDSPGFCFQIAKRCKKLQGKWKIHHIVAPSVWAYKKGRAKKVAKLYDTLFCILPFEPPYFEKHGLKSVFVGYPPFFRMQKLATAMSLPASVSLRQMQTSGRDLRGTGPRQISITLGSRAIELNHHIPIIKEVIAKLNKKFPNLRFCIIALPSLAGVIQKEFLGFQNVFLATEEQKWEEIAKSEFVIAKSGTNVMECAILGVPSVVYYKTGFLTATIIKLMIYNKMGTLLNITASRFVLPEFIQEETKNIHKKAEEWLKNPQETQKVCQEMKKELEKFASKQKPEEIVLENL